MRIRKRGAALLLSAALAAGCATPPGPRLIWEGEGPPRAADASQWATELVDRQPGVRAGAWGASADATFQIIEARAPEQPHIHQSHDLTVVLLRGQGVLRIEGQAHTMRAGDVVYVGRGRVHHFHPTGGDPTLALTIFLPKLLVPDYVQK